MKHYLYTDGNISQYDTECHSLFIFQRMRTKGHTLLHTDKYIDIVNRTSIELFGTKTTISTKELENCCKSLLLRGNYSPKATHIVELRIYENSKFSLQVVETSLYEGFQLRVIRPKAITTLLSGDIFKFPTSALSATNETLRKVASRKEGVALCVDNDGNITNIDGANPVAVFGRRVVLSNNIESVETNMVIEALKRLRSEDFSVENINIDTLTSADEVFFADSRGITSVSEFNGRFYSDALAYAVTKNIKE